MAAALAVQPGAELPVAGRRAATCLRSRLLIRGAYEVAQCPVGLLLLTRPVPFQQLGLLCQIRGPSPKLLNQRLMLPTGLLKHLLVVLKLRA